MNFGVRAWPWGTIAAGLFVLIVYYGTGLHFVYWPDSDGYLLDAMSIGGPDGYQRHAFRSIGYPLFLRALLEVPFPAAVIVVGQALLVAAAYIIIFLHLRLCLNTNAYGLGNLNKILIGWLPFALVATASYGALNVFIASAMPEILFSTLALAAVICVSRFVIHEYPGFNVWLHALAASALAGLPMLVKPHWLLAGPFLALAVAIKIAHNRKSLALPIHLIAAAVIPLSAYLIATWPERHLASATGPATSLFGARTLFCNHLHMINDALSRHSHLTLHPDAPVDTKLREAVRELLLQDKKPWKHLGYTGDVCTYSSRFSAIVAGVFPSADEQRRFFTDSYFAAAAAQPIRFFSKTAYQVILGLSRSFEKFDYHLSLPHPTAFGREFTTGINLAGEAGPLGSKTATKTTLAGWVVLAFLGIIFGPLIIIYLTLMLVSLTLPIFLWRTWPEQRQRLFLAYVFVPMGSVLTHHLLVGVVHSFDIWRYAFAMYFINIYFIISAFLFWAGEVRLLRLFKLSSIARFHETRSSATTKM